MSHKRAWIVYTFFPRRKKVSKKYAEGVRTLSTPMDMGDDMECYTVSRVDKYPKM